MKAFDNFIDDKVIQNIIVWIFIYLIALVSVQSDNVFVTALGLVGFIAIPVYINNLKILPLILSGIKKRIVGIVLFILNLLVFVAIGVFFATNYFIEFEWRFVYNLIGILLMVLVFGSSIKLARDSFVRRQQEKEAQLKLLKAQLNPHFLFNTLNNLYGLSVVKSDKLPNLMLKLSDLLRYSLYDTKDKFVPLEKEMTYLENYMSLEKIRLEDKTDIKFKNDANTASKQIAPMLLIVFVENAFKHLGLNAEGKNYVEVNAHIENDTLKFACKNSFDTSEKDIANMEKGKSGIGLQNAKKRLALMYPEKHELKIKDTKNDFHVELNLQLV